MSYSEAKLEKLLPYSFSLFQTIRTEILSDVSEFVTDFRKEDAIGTLTGQKSMTV